MARSVCLCRTPSDSRPSSARWRTRRYTTRSHPRRGRLNTTRPAPPSHMPRFATRLLSCPPRTAAVLPTLRIAAAALAGLGLASAARAAPMATAAAGTAVDAVAWKSLPEDEWRKRLSPAQFEVRTWAGRCALVVPRLGLSVAPRTGGHTGGRPQAHAATRAPTALRRRRRRRLPADPAPQGHRAAVDQRAEQAQGAGRVHVRRLRHAAVPERPQV